MKTQLDEHGCPIATTLEVVGQWWALLIMRDALGGFRRFDEFAESLPISPAVLTARLKQLTDAGLLERRPYQDRPPRFEYVPTRRGEDLRMVLLAMYEWARRGQEPGSEAMVLRDLDTGQEIIPVLADRATGTPITQLRAGFTPGPAADDAMRARLARMTR